MKLTSIFGLALVAFLSLSACEDEREHHHDHSGSVTTTTTEQTTTQRPVSGATETQTIRSY